MEKTVTVYCASAKDLAPIYTEAAYKLGEALAEAGATLVTGGGRTGLMAAVEEGSLSHGGKTIGVIPQFMIDRGWHHTGLGELRIVPDMHTRKATMASLAMAAVALPGGIGTFEELLEIITWRQLGLFSGNIVIYNVNNYYGPLLSMFNQAIEQGFMQPDHRGLYTVAESVSEVLEAAFAAPSTGEFSPKF